MAQTVAADLVGALPPPGHRRFRGAPQIHSSTASVHEPCSQHVHVRRQPGQSALVTCSGRLGNTLTRALPSLSVLTSEPLSADTARDVIVAL